MLLSAGVCAQKPVLCGTLFSSFVVVHVSAHLANVVNFSASYSDDFPALNLARYRGEVSAIIGLMLSPVPDLNHCKCGSKQSRILCALMVVLTVKHTNNNKCP